MKKISHYNELTAYITRDASEIRELMHPDTHGNKSQSLAEAIVKPNEKTLLHKHLKSEEIYFILQGDGKMNLNKETTQVTTGDTICIMPGTEHNIENTGNENLKILCCCSPAYSHDDTIITT
ncbi:MAG: cupin domain-containing protein [Gammaproteobacteria bacterium]|nr:cupin domain-containing protein [Gammaproteobacteria bacterium]